MCVAVLEGAEGGAIEHYEILNLFLDRLHRRVATIDTHARADEISLPSGVRE